MRQYLHSLLAKYVGLYALAADRISIIPAPGLKSGAGNEYASGEWAPSDADYVILNGTLHYERDVESLLARLRSEMLDHARLIIVYYSALWRPMTSLATLLGWRTKTAELNWLTHGDVENFLLLAGFEVVRLDHKVLVPLYIPVLSNFINRYIAPLPGISSLCMANVLLARPVPLASLVNPSVSVVVPARNEAGNIAAIVARLPQMGPDDELIFVEGGSRDDTWDQIQEALRTAGQGKRIIALRQDGRGKGDAVRKGFAAARNEILMILDADITVPPEDLPKFYRAIVGRKGEFINGSRLVYPMEKRAMRFFNLVANKFFAAAFSYVLGQKLKDTLCGTKVLLREDYELISRNRSFFGDFDPFGDFDLIFGAARMGRRIVEIPIVYRERTYGETNISRWRHGALLFAMLGFAARRLKFI